MKFIVEMLNEHDIRNHINTKIIVKHDWGDPFFQFATAHSPEHDIYGKELFYNFALMTLLNLLFNYNDKLYESNETFFFSIERF